MAGGLREHPSWQRLRAHAERLRRVHLRDLFAADPGRFSALSRRLADPPLLLDLSRQKLDGAALSDLLALAREAAVEEELGRLFAGERVNRTEGRAALHMALRARAGDRFAVDGKDVTAEVLAMRARLRAFAEGVRDGRIRGATGASFTDVVHIGIGGSELGPRAVCRALAPLADGRVRVHFVSNIDPQALHLALSGLDPARTLVLVVSKTFTTRETMANARAARAWLAARLGEAAVGHHFVAISSAVERARDFGIPEERVFGFAEWVGGRFSLWSPVGLSIALHLGFDAFEALLDGARAMDRHVREAPLEANLPVLLALVEVWNRDLLGLPTRVVVPYDATLGDLVLHLQQVEMESNGKSTRRDGAPVGWPTAPAVWGSPGTDGQHAYFQMLHQGTDPVPAEFLVAARCRVPDDGRHVELAANALAQAEALAFGRTDEEARAEMEAAGLAPEEIERLLPHRRFPGDRPCTVLMVRRLDPRTLGALLALYEHKVFVEGVLWDVNSFDQFGVELGKRLAARLVPELSGAPRPELHDAATNALVQAFLAWNREA